MGEIKNKGWTVAMAGLGINLALGIIYTYSILKEAISTSIRAQDGTFSWDLSNLNDPYAVCCLVNACSVCLAGRVQDKLGPRITAVIGGILASLGLIWVSQSYSLQAWILGYGVLMGMGLGFSYSSTVPPALKWLPPSKTGMVVGLIVAGFGLAAVYISPLAQFLIARIGISNTMLAFGVSFFVIVCGLSMFLVNPPAGYKPKEAVNAKVANSTSHLVVEDYKPSEVLRTSVFYRLWIMFTIGAGAGLMIIGNIAGMAKQSLGTMAWVVVAAMALGNACGRLVAGIVSDKFGRIPTMIVMMTAQAAMMALLSIVSLANALLMILAATYLGFNYGTNLSLFPSIFKDFFGLKNFGTNYGLVFTAWGVGGFVLPKMSQLSVSSTGSYNTAYIVTMILLLISAGIGFTIKAPQRVETSSTT